MDAYGCLLDTARERSGLLAHLGPTEAVVRAEELLQVHSTRCGGAVLLRVTGELDLATVPLVRRAAVAALAHRPRRLLLDLTGLVFCDGTGLQALERLIEDARAARTDLRLTGLHPNMHRTLTCGRRNSLEFGGY
ncbi:STAS domain-containing protein [Streptomyces sp. NPDC056480]|uniref:STAS domain-containing protein n=1 Tax=Streptomyces sp. NPDC056480 TaxID=3345833 RepID=UPI00369BAA44